MPRPGPSLATATERVPVEKGREPKSQTVISFFADTGLNELEMHRLRGCLCRPATC